MSQSQQIYSLTSTSNSTPKPLMEASIQEKCKVACPLAKVQGQHAVTVKPFVSWQTKRGFY